MRALERTVVRLDELHPDPRNPRRISEERFNALRRSLRENPEQLEARPIVARLSPRGMIVAGEMRWRAADAEGLATVPAIFVDLDETEARAWLLRDNQEYGEWVEQELAEMLYELQQQGADLELTGFTAVETTRLLDTVAGRDPGPNRWPDEPAPPRPDNPRSKPGVVYNLGPHRLMCGDATNAKHVQKLLGDAKPTLILTDPPYGIDLDLGWRDGEYSSADRAGTKKHGRGTTPANYRSNSPGGRPGRNRASGGATSMQNDDRADWSEAFELVPSAIAIYHWCADVHAAAVLRGLERLGFKLSQFIVWDKLQFALSRAHYHWQHEAALYALRVDPGTEVPWYGPVSDIALYARKPGSGVPFLGARDQTTIWPAPSPKRPGKPKVVDAGEEPHDHPTQKPTLLYTRPMQNHLLRGAAVYDPFGGSGTCVIAAEMMGRVAYTMELDPGFCDVIRDRYKAFTGKAT